MVRQSGQEVNCGQELDAGQEVDRQPAGELLHYVSPPPLDLAAASRPSYHIQGLPPPPVLQPVTIKFLSARAARAFFASAYSLHPSAPLRLRASIPTHPHLHTLSRSPYFHAHMGIYVSTPPYLHAYSRTRLHAYTWHIRLHAFHDFMPTADSTMKQLQNINIRLEFTGLD
jgi:hypothetical protein